MRSSSIRYLAILATLALVGIGIAQVYWVRKAFNQETDHFHREVNAALYQVANKFYTYSNIAPPNSNPIRQLTGNYYVVMLNKPIDVNLLDQLLKDAFAQRDIATDFEYGVYDCDTECMVFDQYVADSNDALSSRLLNLPVWTESNYYFGVYFPSKGRYLLNQMGIWTFTTTVLLVVMVFFGYTLFVILKQKRLSEVQKDFINNMTHEFRTPISTIEVATDVLQDVNIVKNPERLLTYASIIKKENKRLKQQVDRVLQLASIENHNLLLKREKVDLHAILTEVVEHISAAQPAAKLTLSLNAQYFDVIADQTHLANVFYNLIDNAIKYSSSAIVEIETRDNNGIIETKVKDYGKGITKEDQKYIFNKFYRVKTDNQHDVKGFGIGLNYVKTIIDELKGSISLISKVGTGSIFTIKLKTDV